MNVPVVDVGGTYVKVVASDQTQPRRFDSGPAMVPGAMVARTRAITQDWSYRGVSIGYPGPVLGNRSVAEPHNLGHGWAQFGAWVGTICGTDGHNLGHGWVGFDFEAAFGRPVKLINDAAMQALRSYRAGKILFLGLGTGPGAAMIVAGVIEPMELGHLPYKTHTYEHYVGQRGLDSEGNDKWQHHVAEVVAHLAAALEPDDVVLGGGNVRHLEKLPPGCRAGENAHAFIGGFRLREHAAEESRCKDKALTDKEHG
jgi:polyphosphate glucokinase